MVTFLTTTLSNLWETRASSIVYHVYFTTSDASGKLVISNATEGLMPDPLLNANFWLRQSPEKYFILIPWAKNLSIAVEYTELLLTRPGYFSEKLSSKDLSAMATNSHPSKREKIVEMDRDRLVVVVQGLKRQDSLYKQIEAALSVHGRASVFEVDRLLKLKALFLVYRKSGITVAPDDSLLKNYDSLHVDAVARFTLSSISR
jgi:hypothetical protein